MNHDWQDSTFHQTGLLLVLRLFVSFGQYTWTTDQRRCQWLYILMCFININIVLQTIVEFQTRNLHKVLYNILLPDQISNISYSRISGNKWHVKFALSIIILQQYSRLSITKWRSLQFQQGIYLWNTDVPVATESKYGKHLHVLHFDTHGRRGGGWGVSEVRGSNRWTNIPSLFTV